MSLGGGRDKTLALQGANPQSGTGLTFPSAQSASSNANTLDDYEEGTWTPYDYWSGAALNGVLNATYTKIGRLVHVTIGFHLGCNASDANQFRITNLPFTPIGPSSGEWFVGGRYAYDVIGTQVGGMMSANDTAIYFYETANGTQLLPSEMFNKYCYAFGFCYPTAT